MSPKSKGSVPQAIGTGAEASVRQLIANGKFKSAVEGAKDNHKAQGTAASEALLVEAYDARIQSLIEQGLVLEAKSLVELVRERYPSARTRLERLCMSAAARAGTLEELLKPLADPELSAERRAAIEQAIQNQVHDLAALAGCSALPEEHPLRKAASALHAAFSAATSGPVAEGALALPEVSHRSPLAPWKLLIRAIACFYRREDVACREYLDGIQPESAPARLIPAIKAMLGAATKAPLTTAAANLVAQATTNFATIRNLLERLERSFDSARHAVIVKDIRAAVEECRRSSPDQLERLKQHITVRCALAHLDERKVNAALGGACKTDAYFMRLYARGLEQTHDLEDLALACGTWDAFRVRAVQEGWFAVNGPEAAALYIHIANVLRNLPDDLLLELQRSVRSTRDKKSGDDLYFLFPDKLYERACALDPHFEVFSQWLEWARRTSNGRAERVAESWHKIRPADMEPILFLMDETAKRSSYHTALQYLAKAERIDGVNPSVRRARVRLLIGSAVRHLQQKKPHLAAEKADEIAALPQVQQGDRPALVAALRYMVSAARADTKGAAVAQAEIERILESKVAAELLVFGVAAASKRNALDRLRTPRELSDLERAAIPAAMARVVSLAADMNGMTFNLPLAYIDEAAVQISRNGQSLTTSQLLALAEAGLCARHRQLSYAASAAGLEHGGITDPAFLLIRAQSLLESDRDRRVVCAAAAAELARRQGDMKVVDKAVRELHRFQRGAPSLTPDQAAEVVRRERAERDPSTGNRRGPDYSDLLYKDLCQCPGCRQARGESFEDFDDDDDLDAIFDDLEIPPDMPPEIARMLLEATAEAVERGDTLEELISRLTGGGPPKKRKKGGRR